MAQFLDLEAVESGVEEVFSETEVSSASEAEEALNEGVRRQRRAGLAPKKAKAAYQRAKSLPKKAKQISSDEEEEIQKDNAIARGRKPLQKKLKPTQVISSDSEEGADEPARSVPHSSDDSSHLQSAKAPRMASTAAKKRPAETDDVPPRKRQPKKAVGGAERPRPESEDEDQPFAEDPSAPSPPQDPVHYNAQKAMGMLEKICDKLDIKWQGYDIKPDSAIWSKIGGTYMRKKHPEYRLTFSSFDSYHNQIGRFLAAMVYAKANLEPKFLPGGAFVWRHGWFEDGDDEPKCFHGQELTAKPRTVELNPASEAGKRAIADQDASVEKNRFGRQVVVLRFENNAVCYKDADHNGFPYPHANGSCALVFSDVKKAISAMKHDIEWTLALYPNADKKRASECILISASCNCNYAVEGPISGRQMPKMTPYKLSGIEDISHDMCASRKDMEAHKKHPHTMVFTCCNPQSSGVGGGNRAGGGAKNKSDKTCSWRISAMDLRYAYVIANEIFSTVFGKAGAANLQHFKWNDSFAFKTEIITPVCPLESQDPFA